MKNKTKSSGETLMQYKSMGYVLINVVTYLFCYIYDWCNNNNYYSLLQMIALYKDPQGKNVFKSTAITTTQVKSSGTSGSSVHNKNTALAEEEGDSELTLLREKVAQLEAKLTLYKERDND